MLDFRLDTFLVVCKYMNFTKAAQELNITQPAVSQHIHYLEEAYQAKLFEYHAKKLTLTPQGEELLRAATTMKHDSIHLHDHLAHLAQEKRELIFGVTLTIGSFVMPQHLAAYLRKYPQTHIHMVVANTQELLKQLDAGEIDFALVEGYFSKNEYEYRIYATEKYIAVCSTQHQFSKKPRRLEHLFCERLILREPGSGTREILEKQLEERNFSVKYFASLVEINDIPAIKSLVELDCGIAFFYEKAVAKELQENRLRQIELSDFHVSHDFTFLWRRGSIFADYYQELFADLQEGD